VLIPILKQ